MISNQEGKISFLTTVIGIDGLSFLDNRRQLTVSRDIQAGRVVTGGRSEGLTLAASPSEWKGIDSLMHRAKVKKQRLVSCPG